MTTGVDPGLLARSLTGKTLTLSLHSDHPGRDGRCEITSTGYRRLPVRVVQSGQSWRLEAAIPDDGVFPDPRQASGVACWADTELIISGWLRSSVALGDVISLDITVTSAL